MTDLQPAVVTFRPDNLLTVGLMGATAYLGAVLLTQFLMRAGIVKSSGTKAQTKPPAQGSVVSS